MAEIFSRGGENLPGGGETNYTNNNNDNIYNNGPGMTTKTYYKDIDNKTTISRYHDQVKKTIISTKLKHLSVNKYEIISITATNKNWIE